MRYPSCDVSNCPLPCSHEPEPTESCYVYDPFVEYYGEVRGDDPAPASVRVLSATILQVLLLFEATAISSRPTPHRTQDGDCSLWLAFLKVRPKSWWRAFEAELDSRTWGEEPDRDYMLKGLAAGGHGKKEPEGQILLIHKRLDLLRKGASPAAWLDLARPWACNSARLNEDISLVWVLCLIPSSTQGRYMRSRTTATHRIFLVSWCTSLFIAVCLLPLHQAPFYFILFFCFVFRLSLLISQLRTMIIPKKVQKWPPLWLCLGLPIFLLLSAASVYHQEALSEAISKNAPSGLTGDIVSKIYGTFGQSDATKHHEDEPEKPVEPTIIREGNHDEYLAVCLFAKNQAADMVEFFQHHYHELGIRRFYVMDDGSEPPLSTFADEYGIPPEAIDFIYYPHITDVPQGAQL